MNARQVETPRGARVRVLEAGSGAPLVFLHGAAGFLNENPFLDALARRYHVYAPELPGYGESSGEDLLEDMLDFALHSFDVVRELRLERPHLVGHSMGGMIAAEMAAIAPNDLSKLVLADAAGLWLNDRPIPDIFSFLPHEYAQVLFAEPEKGQALLTGGLDFGNLEALADFYIANQRRMATAGKILFPIPNRRVAKRLYRVTAPTLVVWGREDRLMPTEYAREWTRLVPGAELVEIDRAGHMLPYEQPEAFVSAVTRFLG